MQSPSPTKLNMALVVDPETHQLRSMSWLIAILLMVFFGPFGSSTVSAGGIGNNRL
jgi:hypothetical protein